MATTAEKRRANRARRLIRSEARWLQKAVFALSKAEEARDKLADLHENEGDSFTVAVDGSDHDVAVLSTALREGVEGRLEKQRQELKERMRVR